MNFKNLNNFSTSQVKSLFGFHPKILAEILFHVIVELENRRSQRLASRKDRQRPFIYGDGRPREVLPYQKVLMTLLYLRHNVAHSVVGSLFGCSADSSENAFAEVVVILRDLFPVEKWEADKHWRKGEASWSADEIEKVIIDSFETPVPRPSLKERQKRVYSGKKKRHTLKTQIAVDERGEILHINAGHRGPKADLRLYQETVLPKEIAQKPQVGDKGYQNEENQQMKTPQKKPKGGELSEEQKEENKQLAKERVVVEHAIRRVKGFRIMRDEYRMATGIFAMIASAVVGLIQMSRSLG